MIIAACCIIIICAEITYLYYKAIKNTMTNNIDTLND